MHANNYSTGAQECSRRLLISALSSLNSRWSMHITAWQATSRIPLGIYLQVPEQLLQTLCWLHCHCLGLLGLCCPVAGGAGLPKMRCEWVVLCIGSALEGMPVAGSRCRLCLRRASPMHSCMHISCD